MSLLLLNTSILFGVEYNNPDMYYNDALAFYQQKELGKAMYAIKKAYLLAPDVEHIRKLFYTIRYDIGLPPIYATDRLSLQIFAKVFASHPPHINALIGGGLFLGASILVSLLILGKITAYRKISMIGIWFLFVTAGILFLQAGVQYYVFFAPDQRVVLQKISAYEEPSFESTKLIDLPEGTEVTVVAQTDEFLLIRTLDGKEYWVNPQFIPVLWGNLS